MGSKYEKPTTGRGGWVVEDTIFTHVIGAPEYLGYSRGYFGVQPVFFQVVFG